MTNYTEIAATLRAAKALIDTPDKWAKGHYTVDRDGTACYCSVGALAEAGYAADIVKAEESPATGLLDEVVAEVTGRGFRSCIIVDYNDDHTHEEVMAVWDKAIAKADELAKAEQ